MTDEGLYDKFEVYRRDSGNPVDECFVLVPEDDAAARDALREYARSTDDDQLAAELRGWLIALDERARDENPELPSWLHDDIEVFDDGLRLRAPGGTELVNANFVNWQEVKWIDRRSRWGNPFKTDEDGGEHTRQQSVQRYRGYFHGKVKEDEFEPEQLRGEILACWCTPRACHGMVILNHLAETYEPDTGLATFEEGDSR